MMCWIRLSEFRLTNQNKKTLGSYSSGLKRTTKTKKSNGMISWAFSAAVVCWEKGKRWCSTTTILEDVPLLTLKLNSSLIWWRSFWEVLLTRMKRRKRNFSRSWHIKRQKSKTKYPAMAKVNTTWLCQCCFRSKSTLARSSRFKSGSRLKNKNKSLKKTTILTFVPHPLLCPGATAKIWTCTRNLKKNAREWDNKVKRQV